MTSKVFMRKIKTYVSHIKLDINRCSARSTIATY